MTDEWIKAARQVVEHVELISKDVRSNGDFPLVHFDEEGAGRLPYTLADELYLSVAPLRPLIRAHDEKGEVTDG